MTCIRYHDCSCAARHCVPRHATCDARCCCHVTRLSCLILTPQYTSRVSPQNIILHWKHAGRLSRQERNQACQFHWIKRVFRVFSIFPFSTERRKYHTMRFRTYRDFRRGVLSYEARFPSNASVCVQASKKFSYRKIRYSGTQRWTLFSVWSISDVQWKVPFLIPNMPNTMGDVYDSIPIMNQPLPQNFRELHNELTMCLGTWFPSVYR